LREGWSKKRHKREFSGRESLKGFNFVVEEEASGERVGLKNAIRESLVAEKV